MARRSLPGRRHGEGGVSVGQIGGRSSPVAVRGDGHDVEVRRTVALEVLERGGAREAARCFVRCYGHRWWLTVDPKMRGLVGSGPMRRDRLERRWTERIADGEGIKSGLGGFSEK
ncbi:uncharacterized protein M6B38_203335 [Iris pallida]|uniref:Uncharacterized protein n=1 Tax=Iris pallida TaxID=29817 RepID=A0AAX6E8I5_IRIPA|nr:uncharacterized protein M6B38_203335 [Iris pallida]